MDVTSQSVPPNEFPSIVPAAPITQTESTEDATTDANPKGGLLMARRRDVLVGTEVSADGDAVAVNATAKGQVHVFAELSGLDNTVPAYVQSKDAIGDTPTQNPITIGGIARTTQPAASADGKVSALLLDSKGRVVTTPFHIGEMLLDADPVQITAAATETSIQPAVAGTFLDMLWIVFSNSGSSASRVEIRDDTGGTVRMVFTVPAGDTRGVVLPAPKKQTTLNKPWTAKLYTATTMDITASYRKRT